MSIYKRISNPHSLKIKILSNLVLSILVFSVGVLCLAPVKGNVTTEGNQAEIYRSANENPTGISLMFNVYMCTDQVYEILDILDSHEAKATFFIGGCWADDNVDCVKDIYEKGHEIGNHGYFHKDHSALNLAQNQKEIAQCNKFLQLAIGEKITLFAPPSGAYNDTTLTACRALGMKTILWSKDTIDWRDKDPSIIYTRATKNVTKGDFVLMHPTPATVAALEDVLRYYERNSLQLVTVSENLQEKS